MITNMKFYKVYFMLSDIPDLMGVYSEDVIDQFSGPEYNLVEIKDPKALKSLRENYDK